MIPRLVAGSFVRRSLHETGLANLLGDVLYPVPRIDPELWKTHPYHDPVPDAEARAKIFSVESSLGPEIGPERCGTDGCSQLTIMHRIYCRQHHIASLQRIGALPAWPQEQNR